MSGAALRTLAAQAGIAVQWTDAFDQEQQVADDSLRAMLAALQLPAGDDRQCAESLALLRAQDSGAQWPPMLTAAVGRAVTLPGKLPPGARYRLQLEGGAAVMEGRLKTGKDGKTEVPVQQTPGYHTLEAGGRRCVLAVAPQRCFSVADAMMGSTPAAGLPWGLAAQVYSLRRAHDGGLADFSAIESLVQAAARQGASALALSPLHAMFSAAPERFSPYAPSSRMFFNVLHIDPACVLGEASLRQAIAELPGCAAAFEQLEAGDLVDWPQAATWRLRLLRLLFERWHRTAAPDQEGFRQFCDHGGQDLLDHACFEALDAWLRRQWPEGGAGSDWRRWPQAVRDPRGQAVRDFVRDQAEDVDFHRFLQWQASLARERVQREARNAGMALGVVADLAVGADPGGSQAWGLQPAMLPGLNVGAPPDRLAPQGQDWGLGALSPRALREQGFAPWLAMLRANMAHSGGIRIDHVLGLRRLWLVPQGAPSSAGAYLRFPQQDLLRLAALESLRHRAVVIGEDLGTVPPGFSGQLAEAGVLGIRALWFQREGRSFLPPQDWPASAMATTSTHDLSTVAGWWAGRDIDRREALGLLGNQPGVAQSARSEREADKAALQEALQEVLQEDTIADDHPPDEPPLGAVLAYVGSTPAPLVLAPLEDVLGIVEQPNLPGTVEGHPNWRQRLPRAAAALLETPDARRRLALLAAARRRAPAGMPGYQEAAE
ncbi:4-alpha-glucanotransferase [Polaromonas aquatica]|uniref:4-alpha-glucanotransferase n=1 Tax=Polaromonas aquatica TaxID=332657 RepID=UPI003D64C9B0